VDVGREERRSGLDRRRGEITAARDAQQLRELLHDVYHGMAAVRLLTAAAAREDSPARPSRWLRELSLECERLIELTRAGLLQRAGARSAIPVHECVLSAVAGMRLRGVTVSVASVATAFAIIDELELRRALTNVLDNAIRAAAPGGRVDVSVSCNDAEARIDIGDSGSGFGASGNKGSPVSLGLRFSHRVMQGCGGRIEFGESELGGARVSLVLPAVCASTSGAAAQEFAARTGDG
jgi:signal transduction histidine kinase